MVDIDKRSVHSVHDLVSADSTNALGVRSSHGPRILGLLGESYMGACRAKHDNPRHAHDCCNDEEWEEAEDGGGGGGGCGTARLPWRHCRRPIVSHGRMALRWDFSTAGQIFAVRHTEGQGAAESLGVTGSSGPGSVKFKFSVTGQDEAPQGQANL
eukprot:764501-Hanusia_phi.AAC.3